MNTGRRTLARLQASATAVLLVLGAAFVAVAGPAPSADAADLRAFDPGFIISDAIFYDSTTMSAYDVQSFLDRMGATCQPGPDGTPCLRAFRQDTTSRNASALCPGGYVGAAGESAATIIAKVSQGCGINPQVILVMLQKEQGLVRASGSSLTASRYRSAMGYGCPDTAACDAQYYGFFNQVYSAASQFRNYALNPTRYSHRAGMTNNILYNPNTACGSSPVFVQNQATAGLYNYTPYQPNAAALAAGYGTGDSCSAYGNRNFWNYFTDWFGPTTQRAPVGVVDALTTTPTTVSASGWAFDPDTTASIGVHLYIDGVASGGVVAQISRPDVAAVYGKGDLHGYGITVPATPGAHQVCVYAIDSAGGPNTTLGCRTITVTNRPPFGVIDSAAVNGTEVTVTGWALDPDATDSVSVHAYIDQSWAGAVLATKPRPDVGAVYQDGDAHGYSLTVAGAPGPHTLCMYAIDTSGPPNPAIACRLIVLTSSLQRPPIGVIDTATVSGSTVTVAGWALDPDTVQPITVKAYVDGSVAATGVARSSRADVGQVYGDGDLHGYSLAFGAAPGSHTVCLRALDSVTQAETQLECRSFTVAATTAANAAPVGVIDAISVAGTSVTVTGWAFDPDTTAPIGVHFYVDQNWAGATVADQPRPDVGQVYGKGDLHGYTMTFTWTTGMHTVCAYGIDASGGPNPAFQCSAFTVS